MILDLSFKFLPIERSASTTTTIALQRNLTIFGHWLQFANARWGDP